MNNVKYFIYINQQPSKPLVLSIVEAKQYATRHIEYKSSLSIYRIRGWIEQVVTSKARNVPISEMNGETTLDCACNCLHTTSMSLRVISTCVRNRRIGLSNFTMQKVCFLHCGRPA